MAIAMRLIKVEIEGDSIDLDNFNQYPGPFESDKDIVYAIHIAALKYGVENVLVHIDDGSSGVRSLTINIDNTMTATYHLLED